MHRLPGTAWLYSAICVFAAGTSAHAIEGACWRINGGEISFISHSGCLQIRPFHHGTKSHDTGSQPYAIADPSCKLMVENESMFTIDSFGMDLAIGEMKIHGDVIIDGARGCLQIEGPHVVAIRPDERDGPAAWTENVTRQSALILQEPHVQFHRANRQLIVTSNNTFASQALARLAGDDSLPSRSLGMAMIVLDVELDLQSLHSPSSVLARNGEECVPAQPGVIGPDVIVAELHNTSSYGTAMTCGRHGNVCEDDADCNACSDTQGPCLIDSDCKVCAISGLVCESVDDCKRCSGSALPCTIDAECADMESCVADQACVVSGATCVVSGKLCDTEVAAFAVGTTSCNIGDEPATWIDLTNQHPVIAQNMYRLKNDRFEQIGMSWLKHGFFAVTGSLCDECIPPGGGAGRCLGVGCSDPYSAGLNGQQGNLGPRSEVNPVTGEFPFPFDATNVAPIIGRRIQVYTEDLDLDANAGALYFVEGQYITPDDAMAGNGMNNASYRPVEVTQRPDGKFILEQSVEIGMTQRQQHGLRAWQDTDPSVAEADAPVPGEGLFIVAAKAIDLGTGFWRYEYAVQNFNSHQGCRSFQVPLPEDAIVEEIGFHDIEHHSGEPFDRMDWTSEILEDAIRWSTQTFTENPNANAIRWGSLYNFHFDANVQPDSARSTPSTIVVLELFRPGLFDEVSTTIIGPSGALIDCNDNEIPDRCDLDCNALDCVVPCGMSSDCNSNGVPDECERDCNTNGVADTCDIANATSEDCNANTVPDECEPDCDGDMLPDDCDTFDDTDGDGVPDCFDPCPLTNPTAACECPALGRCCFTEFFCLDEYPLANCKADGGVPDCQVSALCREGCLLFDFDDDGDIDLFDLSALQGCFSGGPTEPGFQTSNEQCNSVFDVTEDGAIDLADYVIAHVDISGP